MKRWGGWLALAAALGVMVGAALYDDARTRAHLSFYSTYDTGPRGYRALYETLVSARVPVRRFERELGLLDPDVRTLVISSSRPELNAGTMDQPINRADRHRLARFVERGGRLIVLDAENEALLALFHLDGRRFTSVAERFERAPVLPITAPAARIDAPAQTLYRYGALRESVALFGTRNGAIAAAHPYGKGVVIAILAPDLFANRFIGRADNARFAFALLADGAPVAFDERVHGYTVDKSFWDALPLPVHVAVWIVAFAVLLWLVGANVRFRPPVSPEPPDERDSSAYIASMAALLRRARAWRAALTRFADDAAQRMRARSTVSPTLRRSADELAALAATQRPDAATLVRAAQLSAQLRKDLA